MSNECESPDVSTETFTNCTGSSDIFYNEFFKTLRVNNGSDIYENVE